MKPNLFLFCWISSVCFLTTVGHCANILVVMPIPARSHMISFQPLFEELIIRGHNLTLISPFSLGSKFGANYTFVDVKERVDTLSLKIYLDELKKSSAIGQFATIWEYYLHYVEEILKFDQVQRIINSEDHYDLVVAELFFVDCFIAFGKKFDAPVVAFSPMKLFPNYNWILGNPSPPSYVPSIFYPMTERMSLASRITNTIFSFYTVLHYELLSLPACQRLIEKYFHFDAEHVPHIKEIIKNISVTFVTSFEYVKPELPNIVHVAGLHFYPPKTLPLNLKKFMDEAEHGVIYLSFGSFLQPEHIKHLQEPLIRTLRNLPQRVVMKWDPSSLSDIPDNILAQNWLPQTDILNHPKCQLFITHGGLHSCLESLNASVPVVGVPFFSDQWHNIAVMEYHEMGIMLTIDDIPTKLAEKVDEVLKNPKYKINMRKRSMLFRERLVKPLDTAMYWIDHVLKHKNTDHLKSAALQLSWYELYSVDVMAILLLIVLLTIYSVKIFAQFLTRKLSSFKKSILTEESFCEKEKKIK